MAKELLHSTHLTSTLIDKAGSAGSAGDVLKVNAAADGVEWGQSSGGATVTTNKNAGETPTTNPPASPSSGDVFINTADGLTWVHDGTTWQSIVPNIPKTYFGTAGNGAPTGTPVAVYARYLDEATGDIYVADATPAWPGTATETLNAGDTFFDFIDQTVYEGQ